MWDRFRGAVPQKLGLSHHHQPQQRHHQPQYGSGGDIFAGPGVRGSGSYSYSVQGGPAPTWPPREYVDQRAHYHPDEPPALQQDQHPRNPYRDDETPFQPSQHRHNPYRDEPPTFREDRPDQTRRNPYRDSDSSAHLHAQSRRDSRTRPPSSVYSPQPSPIQTNFSPGATAAGKSYAFDDSADISPPSSPEPFNPGANGAPRPATDISPIEEDEELYDDMQQQGALGRQKSHGNIGSLRRERRQQQDAAAGAALRESRSREQMRSLQPPQPRSVSGSRRGWDPATSGGAPRWDPSTGELTSSEKGRPSQVKPAEYAKGLGHSPESDRTGCGTEAGPVSGMTAFGQRVRRIAPPGFVTGGAERKVSSGASSPSARRPSLSPSPSPSPRQASSPMSPTAQDPAAGAFMSQRPPWKGASGRTTLVDPVRDNPDIAPLSLPRKRGPKSPTATGAMASPPASPLGAETRLQPLDSTIRQAAAPSSDLSIDTAATGYPSPPYSGIEAPSQTAPETAITQPMSSLTQSPSTMSPAPAIRRKPAPSSQPQNHQQNSTDSMSSQDDPYNYENYTATNPPPGSGANDMLGVPSSWTQPPSRFSVSTVDSSTHATPRPSGDGFDDEAHREAYASLTGSSQKWDTDPTGTDTGDMPKQESVMDRRRPKLGEQSTSPGGHGAPVVISLKDAQWTTGLQRKPLAPGAGNGAGSKDGDQTPTGPPKNRPESFVSMAGSIYKSLPPAPPETSAVDRVDALNARLRALANRRINITRSVKQMTELMPTDNIMASAQVLHKREVEARKVEALRMELAEVQREEYELGIKLHRAYKRIERETNYEPTTLWVRRVTG